MDAMLGEIRLFAFQRVNGLYVNCFLPCDGRTMQINEWDALYAAIGTAYGGDGRSTFALPNLGGRVIIGGSQYNPQYGGSAGVALAPNQAAQHTHTMQAASDAATAIAGEGAYLATVSDLNGQSAFPVFAPAASGNLTTLKASSVVPEGGVPHENRQPFLVLAYMICVQGLFGGKRSGQAS